MRQSCYNGTSKEQIINIFADVVFMFTVYDILYWSGQLKSIAFA